MNSTDKLNWEKLFAFSDDNERTEHEADMLSLKIALEINTLLEEKGISKKEFAVMMDTSPAYITQVLRGDKRVNMLFLAKLQKALGVKLEISFSNNIESDRELLNEALDYGFQSSKRDAQKCLAGLLLGFAASSRRYIQ